MQTPYSYRDDPAVPAFPDDRPVIIFDGECVLCSGSAQFVLRHDKRRIYRFLAAQTPLGRALYGHYGLDTQDYETMIVIADGIATFKSEAVVRIAEGLGLPWSLAALISPPHGIQICAPSFPSTRSRRCRVYQFKGIEKLEAL